MKKFSTVIILMLLTAMFVSACSKSNSESNEQLIEKAESLFNEERSLSDKFDEDVVKLYSDEAEIKFVIIQSGKKQEMKYGGKEFKEMVARSMSLAKERNDKDVYSDVKYEVLEDKRVKITANRYSNLYKYDSPFSCIVGPDTNGEWKFLKVDFEMHR
ncbi:hypothetical protein I6N90_13040 [Paenibacillus sp. GSMTC-2017]|uniref:hypothetical protein n=1 Tax=Paenibacillus sp. GSMTC-2017 TaxID=2794350 RepID=UPI0018D6A944|nr:hypothetical protein [Paenibacillus sp. GSMTC-2017]MBH5318725.1 hypothetical protein [Paenibacillus sp. GSMTC-2017]